MRKIAVFTASRTEYGILRPIIRAISKSSHLKLQLIVAGMHFLEKFGNTFDLIKNDGFEINAKIQFSKDEDLPGRVGLEVGNTIIELTKTLIELNSDIVLVIGDRSDALACAISAALLPMPLAHVHGGDVSGGGTDESVRHVITKLAHIHFAASNKSKKRIIQMGENHRNVFLVGAPGLDEFVNTKSMDSKSLERQLNIKIKKPLLVILQHPVTTSINTASLEIKTTLKSVSEIDGTKIIIYPNGDPGSNEMIYEIEKYRGVDDFYIFPNLERLYFINLLRNASVLVGNSSGGIIETATIHLPTVNIGSRQYSRERNANVIDVDYDPKQIKNAINICLNNRVFLKKVRKIKNLYGDGKAASRIVKILEKIKLGQLLQKHYFDVAEN